MTWVEGYEFCEPLQDLRAAGWQQDLAAKLTVELHRELTAHHALHGRQWRVIARALPNDDVVAVCDDDVVVVHLTWRNGAPERSPWPLATPVRSADELNSYVAAEFGDREI